MNQLAAPPISLQLLLLINLRDLGNRKEGKRLEWYEYSASTR